MKPALSDRDSGFTITARTGAPSPTSITGPSGLSADQMSKNSPVCASRSSESQTVAMLPMNSKRYPRSEEHTSEFQSLTRISYAVFCLKKKNKPYRIFNAKLKNYHHQ